MVYFDDGHDIRRGGFELGHIHIEMVQSVALRLGQDDIALLAHSMNAPEVGGGVQGRTGGFGNGHFGDGGRETAPFVTRGSQRGIGGTGTVGGEQVLFVLFTVVGILGVFAFEEAHDEEVDRLGGSYRGGQVQIKAGILEEVRAK